MKLCEYCGGEYSRKSFTQRFCCPWCNDRYYKMPKDSLESQIHRLQLQFPELGILKLTANFLRQRIRDERLRDKHPAGEGEDVRKYLSIKKVLDDMSKGDKK